jgi:hypothetical protein
MKSYPVFCNLWVGSRQFRFNNSERESHMDSFRFRALLPVVRAN